MVINISYFNLNKLKRKINDQLLIKSKRVGINLHYLIKNSFWITLNQLVSIILGLLLSVFLARFLSKEVFGNYNLILSIISLLAIISMPGINISLTKAISRGKDGTYTKSTALSFIWSMLGVPMLLILGVYYYFYEQPEVGITLLLASIFFPLLYGLNTWINFLNGKKRFDLSVKYSIIQTFFRTFTIITILLLGVTTLVPIFAVFLLINSFFNVYYYYRSKKLVINNIEEKNWKSYIYKLSFVEFSALSYEYADKIIIGILLGPFPLAVYSIAATVISQIKGSMNQLLKIYYPKIFEMENEDILFNLKKFFPKFILLNVGILTLIIILMPWLILLLFSDKYSESIVYAQLYSITIPLSLFMIISGTILIALNNENELFRFRSVGTIVLLGLYLTLIPAWGLYGAIIGSIIYYIFVDALQYYYINKIKNS